MEILSLEFSLNVIKIIHQLMSHTLIKTRVIRVLALPVNHVESLILNNDGSLRQCGYITWISETVRQLFN